MPAEQPGMVRRAAASWRNLRREQRLAGTAALALFLTMFLPWYTKSTVGVAKGQPVKVQDTLSAFGAFSFVEAAVLLVAVGVAVMLFFRGEGRGFHLPGGDGTVITGAGVWVCFLVFYRQLDKPGGDHVAGLSTTVGVSWGIFVTFIAGLFLAYAGTRLRLAHLSEPPLPADAAPTTAAPARRGRRDARRRAAVPASDQLSFDDEPPARVPGDDPPAPRVRRRAAPLGEPPTFDDPPPEFPRR